MKYVKPIVRILLSITLLVVLVLAFVYMPKQRCERISAVAHTQNESVTVSPKDVEAMLTEAGIEVVGQAVKEVDLGKIITLLKANPYIAEVNFVHFAGRKLVIDYTLKELVLHVFTPNGDHYFVDSEGCVVPFTSKMKDYLMIVNGNLPESYKSGKKAPKGVQEALVLTKKINEDAFYQAMFRQIYLNKGGLELTSAIGGHTILFGTSENADEKLRNLKTVYEKGLSHKGYDTYAQLDARYTNRIIATKK